MNLFETHQTEESTPARVTSSGSVQGRTAAAIRNLSVPTRLLVGGNDDAVTAAYLEARAHLRREQSIEILTGAGHFSEEPGALDTVASLAARWFCEHVRVKALARV